MNTMFYKLTDKDGQTSGKVQWGPGLTHEALPGEGPIISSKHWILVYRHPLVAVFAGPGYGDYNESVKLWEAEISGETLEDGGLALCAKSCTTIREVERPSVTLEQRVRFGILTSLEGYSDAGFEQWARRWLSGDDRSAESARAVRAAILAAEIKRAEADLWAAWAADLAARGASRLAETVAGVWKAWDGEYWTMDAAALAASWMAHAIYLAGKAPLDFAAIANSAVSE